MEKPESLHARRCHQSWKLWYLCLSSWIVSHLGLASSILTKSIPWHCYRYLWYDAHVWNIPANISSYKSARHALGLKAWGTKLLEWMDDLLLNQLQHEVVYSCQCMSFLHGVTSLHTPPSSTQLHLEAKKQEGSLEALRTELEQSHQDRHEKVRWLTYQDKDGVCVPPTCRPAHTVEITLFCHCNPFHISRNQSQNIYVWVVRVKHYLHSIMIWEWSLWVVHVHLHWASYWYTVLSYHSMTLCKLREFAIFRMCRSCYWQLPSKRASKWRRRWLS